MVPWRRRYPLINSSPEPKLSTNSCSAFVSPAPCPVMDTDDDDARGSNSKRTCANCSVPVPIAVDDVCIECFECKLAVHVACMRGATMEQIQAVKKVPNAVFVCDACMIARKNGKNDDRHSKNVLREICTKLNELSCVVELAKNFDKKVKKIVGDELVRINKRSIAAAADEGEEKSRRETLRSAAKKRKVEGEAPLCDAINGSATPKTSYADLLKQSVEQKAIQQKKKQPNAMVEKTNRQNEPARKPDPVVVIMPKPNVVIDDAIAELRKKVDAKGLNVKRVTGGKDGTIVVALKDEASVEKLKQDVEKNLGERYQVKLRETMRPTLKIVGMTDELDEEELKELLVDQNDAFDNLTHFKLRKKYRIEKWRFKNHCAIVELDARTFFRVMEMEETQLNVGWDQPRYFDGLEVTRCFKCCGFNHKASDCKAAVVICPICSENHEVKECNAEFEKCVNCEKMRVERKLNIDVDHTAWSSQCPLYLRQRERRNKMVDYTK